MEQAESDRAANISLNFSIQHPALQHGVIQHKVCVIL